MDQHNNIVFDKKNIKESDGFDSEKNNSNKYKILIIIVIVLVFILLIAGVIWWLISKEKEKETVVKEVTTEGSCGEIFTEDGKTEGIGPYSPVVEAKITGTFPKDKEICEWTVNGEDFGKSAPYGNYCIRYGLTFNHLGEYKISYKVAGFKNCPKEATLKITSLTPDETIRQAVAIQKLIDSGMTVEEIEAEENHMLRKY